MPDYLAPFLQQLSDGTRVIQQLKQQALQQDQMKFEREQVMRGNTLQDRMLANQDIGQRQQLEATARPVSDGTIDAPMYTPDLDPVTGVDTGRGVRSSTSVPVNKSRVVTYRNADGTSSDYELMTPEEIAARRMEELRAATQIKMLPQVFTQQQANARADADRKSRETIATTTNDTRKQIADGANASRVDVAKVGAASRESVAKVGAASREKAAGISAQARRDAAATSAAGGLSAAQIGVQGRFDEGRAGALRKQLDDAEKEIQALHAKKLEAGQAKYPSNKYSDPAKAREAVLSGLDGKIKAAEQKRASAQQQLEGKRGGQQQQSGAPKVANLDQIKRFAASKGISVDEAVRQARKEGYQVK